MLLPHFYLVVTLRAAHPLHESLVGEVGRVAGAAHATGRHRRKERPAKHAPVHALDRRRPAQEKTKTA